MPVRKTRKIGEVHHVTYEKTLFDKATEFVGRFLVVIVVLGLIGTFLG